MSALDELRSLYRSRRLLPFVGAGVSASVCWNEGGRDRKGPTWSELVDQAIAELGFEFPELLRARGTDLQILEYFSLHFSGHSKLINWLVKRMSPPDDAVRASGILQELSAMEQCRVIYTTNYDDFIERAVRLNGRRCQSVAIEEHMRGDPNEAEVVKFHGDWDHPQCMVLTESDYDKRMSFRTPMDYRLCADLLNTSALFIGYSFRDPNVAYLFRTFNAALSGLPNSSAGRRAYIALEDPSQFEYRLFRERNIEVVPIDGADRPASIASLLKEVRS